MTREYDDGYDSSEAFERAHADNDLTDEELIQVLINRRNVPKTDDDYMHAAWTMERMGGGFAARIAQAYYVADKDNRARLRATFRELFERYHREYQREGEMK